MDTIIYNGIIGTIDSDNRFAQALSIKDGKIVQVGKNQEILDRKSADTELIDLEGKLLLPGFNDSHMHLLNYSQSLRQIDLVGVESIEEIIVRSKEFIKNTQLEENQWVKGRGWNHDFFKDDKVFPTRYDLDKISREYPIMLSRACEHIVIVNSKALEIIGISKDSPQIEGGHFDLDQNGQPLGIFRENAISLISKFIPSPSIDDIKEILIDGIKNANACGITSIQSDDFDAIPGDNYYDIIKAYEELKDEGKMNVRVYEQCLLQNMDKLNDFLDRGYNTGYGDQIFKIGPLKLLADGSLGARTAALTKPYVDAPETSGISVFTQEEMDSLVDRAHCSGMQVAIHGIGDKTMYQAFEALEKALEKYPRDDH